MATSSSLTGPSRILQRASKFTKKTVRSNPGGEVYAPTVTVDRTLFLKDLFGPFEDINPGVAGLEDCESLLTHLKTKKMIAEKYLVRHSLSTQ